MSEDEARDLLRTSGGVGPLDAWIADQPWVAVPGGWHVGPARNGWRFEIRMIPEGLQIRAHMPGTGQSAVRVVPRAVGAGQEVLGASRAAPGMAVGTAAGEVPAATSDAGATPRRSGVPQERSDDPAR